MISDRDFAEAMPGSTRHEEILEFALLIEDWAAPYVGRDGAPELDEDELEVRRWRIAGFPEDQIQDMVDSTNFVRQARKAGHTRAQIRKLLAEHESTKRSSRTLSTEPLGLGGLNAEQIIAELDRVVDELVSRGETQLHVRLDGPYDAALERSLIVAPGAYIVLDEHVHALARRHPSIAGIQIAAGGLPTPGWTFRKEP
jgi:transposase